MKQFVPENLSDVSSGGISTTEDVNLPAGSEPSHTTRTRIAHTRNVNYAIPDKNAGLMEKLHCAILNYLRKIAN